MDLAHFSRAVNTAKRVHTNLFFATEFPCDPEKNEILELPYVLNDVNGKPILFPHLSFDSELWQNKFYYTVVQTPCMIRVSDRVLNVIVPYNFQLSNSSCFSCWSSVHIYVCIGTYVFISYCTVKQF